MLYEVITDNRFGSMFATGRTGAAGRLGSSSIQTSGVGRFQILLHRIPVAAEADPFPAFGQLVVVLV